MNTTATPCANCGALGMFPFYQLDDVPTNSVLLLHSQSEALQFPRGSIQLAVCHTCGFISNLDFDPKLTEYSARYEATQGYSPTFNKFHQQLARDLIDKYDLRHKTIIEIGCDKGDFLTMLCEVGSNHGVGFDPAYAPGRHPSPIEDQLTFIADFYSEKYAHYTADFICCKMTLEHIPETADFVNTVRRAIGQDEAIVFFQIPNADYVLDELAFWDVYYEHCSYFTKTSLAYLFQHAGFEPLELWTDYDDQYLMIAARPARPGNAHSPIPESDVASLLEKVGRFAHEAPQRIARWQAQLQEMKENGKRIVLWGGGSKGVAFLTTLGLTLNDVQYVVDVNPHKAGTFMAGTGQEIVAPSFLQTYCPDVVIIMNPIYRAEISRDLRQMGLTPQIMTV